MEEEKKEKHSDSRWTTRPALFARGDKFLLLSRVMFGRFKPCGKFGCHTPPLGDTRRQLTVRLAMQTGE